MKKPTTNTTGDYTETWLEIGRKNPWIRRAWDPPFDKTSFHHCSDAEELKKQLEQGNWCLGQAFCLGELCFIQQVDGGDEWLTIKKDLAFESISLAMVIKRGEFSALLQDLQNATLEQCRKLEYRQRVAAAVSSSVHRCNSAEEAITILSGKDKD